MPGLFDDLVPAKPKSAVPAGGLFDDLVPSKWDNVSTGASTVGEVLLGDIEPIAPGEVIALEGMAPERSWGDVGTDAATRIRQTLNSVVGGVVGAPTNIANLPGQFPRQMLGLADKFGLGDYVPQLARDMAAPIQQPDAVQGIRQSLALNTEADQVNLSPKALAQAEAFDATEGLGGALSYLAQNPSYAGVEALGQLPQFLQMVPGSVAGTIAAQSVGAGAQNAQQVEEELIRQGATPEEAASAATTVFGASAGVNAAIPMLTPGGTAVERMIANRVGTNVGSSTASRVAIPLLGETLSEGVVEGVDQGIQNLGTGKPITEGVGRASALGMSLGAGPGAVAGITNAVANRNTAPAVPAPVASLLGDLLAGDSAPSNAIAPTPPELAQGLGDIAPEDLAALDALLAKNQPVPPDAPISPKPAAPAPQTPDDIVAMARTLLGDDVAAALGLGDMPATDTPSESVDPDARFRRPAPESAPAAPSAIAADTTRTSLPAQILTPAQAVQAPAGPSAPAPVGADLAQPGETAATAAPKVRTPERLRDDLRGIGYTPDLIDSMTDEQVAAEVAQRDAGGGRLVPASDPVEQASETVDDDTPAPPLDIRYGKPRLPQGRAAADPVSQTTKAVAPPVDALESTAGVEVQELDLTPGESATLERQRVDKPAIRASLSRDEGEADADRLGLRAAVDKAVGGSGVTVEYLRGQDGLPAGVRDKLKDQSSARNGKGRTAGLYVPGKNGAVGRVFVFADVATTPKAAAFTAAHEIAGHHGLRMLAASNAKVGNRSAKQALDAALDMALQNPSVAAVADSMISRRKSSNRLLMAEEALADLAAAARTGNYDEIQARHGVTVPEAQRKTLRGAIERFVQRLKQMLNAARGRESAFSDADVYALLENAWKSARKTDAAAGEVAEQVDDGQSMDGSVSSEALESVVESGERAEARRNEAAGTLPVSRGTAGWHYDEGRWEGRAGQVKRARAQLQDKMLSWRDVQGQISEQVGAAIPDAQDVYRLENLMHGRVSEGIDRIERSQVEPLLAAMKAANVAPATLEDYLYARHATERNEQIASINPSMSDGGSGMTTADAARALSSADPKLAALAKRVDAITTATRKRLLDNGLITQQAHDAMAAQYAAYVPLRGKATSDTDFAGGGMAGRGLDTRGKPVREALGRGAGNRAVNILGEIIGDAQRSVILAEKARVGRSVMRLVLANPNPALWQVEPVQTERALDANGEVYEKVVNDWSDPSVVAVRHRGTLFKVQINHQPLAQALNNVGVDQLGAVSRVAGQINRYFSAVLTKYNPAFVPVNAARDALFGLTGLATEHGEAAALDAALHYAPAARAAFRHATGKTGSGEWDTWVREFAEAGGKTGYVSMPSAEDLSRSVANVTLGGPVQKIVRTVKPVMDMIGAINDAVENALRLSAYVTLRKRGMSAEKAASYAKDLTVNFNRKGFDGSKLNAWFLFYNASLQGGHRVTKVLRKPKAWGYVGGLAGVQVMAAMAAMGMEDDDGEPLWNKVPDHVKRRNLVLVHPKGYVVTIPMPYGFNIFPYMAGRVVTAITDRDETNRANMAGAVVGDILSAATESFSPVPLGDGALGFLPTVLRIPVNVQTNRNDFDHAIRKESPFSKYDIPKASMGRPDTLELFKLGANGLNRLGGGDEYTPPTASYLDWAPEDIEYLLGEIGGGAGKFVIDVATAGQKAAGNDPMTLKDIPIVKRFATNIDEQAAQQSMYYERSDVLNRSLERVRDVFEQKGAAAAEKLLAESPELTGAAFKRRKGEGRQGQAPGSIIVSDGRPQIVVADEASVFGAYKKAEKAITGRGEQVRSAYTAAPAALLPTPASRERDGFIRTANTIRQAAQHEFNSAWTRDVVGSTEAGPDHPVRRSSLPESRRAEYVGIGENGKPTPAPDVLTGAKNAPKLVMVGDHSDLPSASVHEALDGGARGVFDPKERKAYVVMGLEPAEAKFVAYHEIAGHYGLQGALGADYEKTLNRAMQNPTVDKLARAMEKSGYKGEFRLALVEEALSELAAARRSGDYGRIERERGIKVPDSAKPGIAGMLSRVGQLTKRKLADLTGEEPDAFDDEQVYSLIEDAWQYVEHGR